MRVPHTGNTLLFPAERLSAGYGIYTGSLWFDYFQVPCKWQIVQDFDSFHQAGCVHLGAHGIRMHGFSSVKIQGCNSFLACTVVVIADQFVQVYEVCSFLFCRLLGP